MEGMGCSWEQSRHHLRMGVGVEEGGWRAPYRDVVKENGRRSRVYVKTPGRPRMASTVESLSPMMNCGLDPPSPLFVNGGRKVLNRSSVTYSRTSRARSRSRSGFYDFSAERDAFSDLDGPMEDDSDSDEEWALMQSSDSDCSLASPSSSSSCFASPSSACSASSSCSNISSSSSSSSSSVILQPDLVSSVVRAVGPVLRLFLHPAFFSKQSKSQSKKKSGSSSGGGGSGGNSSNADRSSSSKKEKKRVKVGKAIVDGGAVKLFSSSVLSH